MPSKIAEKEAVPIQFELPQNILLNLLWHRL